MSSHIETLDFDSAEAFLDALSPRNELWSDDPDAWLFRGQSDASWSLRPKAQRGSSVFDELGLPPRESGELNWSQRSELVKQCLEKFASGLEKAGVVFPVESPRVRSVNQTFYGHHPERSSFPLMALAQHHGLPTHLLDWSRRSLVAAYFAATVDPKPKEPAEPKQLAVWALRESVATANAGLHLYEAPGGTNPNLAAQAGVFTYLTDPDSSLEDWLQSFDETAAAERLRKRSQPPIAFSPAMRCLRAPSQLAPKLLRLLSYEAISGASMFPGIDGIVRAMREQALWDQPPPSRPRRWEA